MSWISQVALLAIALATAVPGSAASGSSIDPSADACTTSQLTVHVARWLLGTTHTGGDIAFANHSHSPCRLTGWPVLAGVKVGGATTLARHVRSTWFGPYVEGVPV